MRRLTVVVTVVVALLAVTVLVDRLAARGTAAAITSQMATAGMELGPESEVRIEGFPYLTQLLSGRLREVTITADTASVDGMMLTDLHGVTRGVGTSPPYVAESAEFTATMSTDALSEAMRRAGPAGATADAEVDVTDTGLAVSAAVFGLPLRVVLGLVTNDGAITFELEHVSLAGFTVSADSIPDALEQALAGLAAPAGVFPDELAISDVTLLPGEGIQITMTGSDVALETLFPVP